MKAKKEENSKDEIIVISKGINIMDLSIVICCGGPVAVIR